MLANENVSESRANVSILLLLHPKVTIQSERGRHMFVKDLVLIGGACQRRGRNKYIYLLITKAYPLNDLTFQVKHIVTGKKKGQFHGNIHV